MVSSSAMLLALSAVIVAFAPTDAAYEECYVCPETCAATAYDADYDCYNYDEVQRCENGCYTELSCATDGSGNVCVTKRCTKPDNICIRPREFYPVVWAGPEESDDCSVSECCKGDYCNEYSADNLDATLRACCPDCKKCPVDLIFVVDTSLSIEYFKESVDYVKTTIAQFNPDLVRVGVVCFATEADTIVHLGQTTLDITALLLDAIPESHDGRSTYIFKAIEEMADEFQDHYNYDPHVQRVGVVITDGFVSSSDDFEGAITDAMAAISSLNMVAVVVNGDVDTDTHEDISDTVFEIYNPDDLVEYVADLSDCH